MGEKIKDLHTIKIGNSEFMVELNEGYSKNEGRLIHIQNEHFRYLIDEKGFYKLSTTVLRAKVEKDFYKNNNRSFRKTSDFSETMPVRKEDVEAMSDFCCLLDKYSIDYRKVESSCYLNTIIIDLKDKKAFKKLIEENKIKSLNHPFGETNGYSFMYQMTPFELYSFNKSYIEIIYQIPCLSLTPLTWIPLDKSIQQLVFSTNKDNKELNNIAYIIYKISWAIFKDRGFSKTTINILKSNKHIYADKVFQNCLSMVFFKFTQELIKLLINEEYDSILDSYYNFEGY